MSGTYGQKNGSPINPGKGWEIVPWEAELTSGTQAIDASGDWCSYEINLGCCRTPKEHFEKHSESTIVLAFRRPITPAPIPSQAAFAEAFTELAAQVHANNAEKGWWDKERNDFELIALMHTELSEAVEALRHGNPPDNHIPEFSGTEAEFADTVIRIMDYAHARKLRVGEAIIAKIAYNKTRPHKHGNKLA